MVSCPADSVSGKTQSMTTIGGGGDRADPEVNTDVIGSGDRLCFGYFDSLKQKPLLAVAFEVGLPLDEREEMLAFLSDFKIQPDTLGERAKGDALFVDVYNENPLVIGNGDIGMEGDRLQFPAVFDLARAVMLCDLSHKRFVGGADFCNDTDHQLRGQVELFPDGMVSQLLEIMFVEGLVEKGDFGQTITHLSIPLTRCSQELIGVFVGLKFEFQHQFHAFIIPDKCTFVKRAKDSNSPPGFTGEELLSFGLGHWGRAQV
ncbi:MAG: hypothetical protein JWL77_4591 [Chthonomonadaceae bacterium]|nr:hypothetical protein [Chthonomonadaceae bacterium]